MRPVMPGFWGVATQLPLYVVWLIGIIVAVVRWSKHPRASLLALCGLLIFLVWGLGSALLGPWIQMTLLHSAPGLDRMGLLIRLGDLLGALVRGAAWVMVIAAIFWGREATGES
jgi:hypothetical protein